MIVESTTIYKSTILRGALMRTNETKLLKFLLYDIKKGKKSSIFAQILTFQWKYFEKIMFNGLLTVYF